MFALLNPFPRLGMLFQPIPDGGDGPIFYNNTGATIKRGYVAAVDIFSTATSNNDFQYLIPIGASSNKMPLVVALADVASGQTSTKFTPLGQVKAVASVGTYKGVSLTVGTASTGGSTLTAATNGGYPAVGFYASDTAADGTTPDFIVFNGIFRGALAGTTITAGILP